MIGTSAKLSLNCRPSIKRTIREVRRKWIFGDKIRCWSDLIQGPKENNNPQKSWMSLEFIWVKVFLILLAKNLARMPWIKMESTTYDFPPLSISVSPSQRLLLSASRHSTVIGSHRLVIERRKFSFVIWTLQPLENTDLLACHFLGWLPQERGELCSSEFPKKCTYLDLIQWSVLLIKNGQCTVWIL